MMPKEIKTLKELGESGGSSKASQIRHRYEQIKRAVDAGASYREIAAALKLEGVETSAKHLAKVFNQERQKRNRPPRASPIKHGPEQTTATDEEATTNEPSMTEEQIRRKELLEKVDSIPSDYESLKKYSEKIMKKIEKSGGPKE